MMLRSGNLLGDFISFASSVRIAVFLLCASERGGLGGSADHASRSRQHNPAQRHGAECFGVQRVDRVTSVAAFNNYFSNQ